MQARTRALGRLAWFAIACPRAPYHMRYFIIALLIAAPPVLAQRSPIDVGPNVQISTARAGQTHNEVLAGADPENARNLIACAIVGRSPTNAMLTVAYVSFDGGATWNAAVADSSGAAGDPACVYGPGGRAYFTSLGRSWEQSPGLRVFYSADAGRTWKESATPPFSRPIDREYVVVDGTAGKNRGRVYVYAQTWSGGFEG